MAKKRKSDAMHLDEVDRSMYSTFCNAANSLSQLYTQAMNHQRVSFLAGERHALEKLYQSILRQQEGGARVTTADVVVYLQNELDYGADEPPSPRMPHQHFQATTQFNNSGIAVSSRPSSPATIGQGTRADQQGKNSVFSNALSSPVRRGLQHYNLAQNNFQLNNAMSSGNGAPNNQMIFLHQHNRDTYPNSPISNDSMDIHADSPCHGFSC